MPTLKIHQATDTAIQPLLTIVFASLFLFGILGFTASFFPAYSALYLYMASLLASGGIISSIWLNQKPNLLAKFFKFLSISSLCTIITARLLGFLFPQISGIIATLVILSVATAYLFPVLNSADTMFVRQESSYSPQTPFGKALLKYSLLLLPIAGVVGASIGLFSSRHENAKYMGLAIFMGPLTWFIALVIPFSTKSPVSPWEHREQKNDQV